MIVILVYVSFVIDYVDFGITSILFVVALKVLPPLCQERIEDQGEKVQVGPQQGWPDHHVQKCWGGFSLQHSNNVDNIPLIVPLALLCGGRAQGCHGEGGAC